MTTKPTVDLKEVAQAADCSESTAKRKYREWGLEPLRSKALHRRIRFFRRLASEQLIRIKVIDRPL